MSRERYLFQGQKMQTVEYRNIHGPKKNINRWMRRKNGPKKWSKIFGRCAQKKWAKIQGQGEKNGTIWLQLPSAY